MLSWDELAKSFITSSLVKHALGMAEVLAVKIKVSSFKAQENASRESWTINLLISSETFHHWFNVFLINP